MSKPEHERRKVPNQSEADTANLYLHKSGVMNLLV